MSTVESSVFPEMQVTPVSTNDTDQQSDELELLLRSSRSDAFQEPDTYQTGFRRLLLEGLTQERLEELLSQSVIALQAIGNGKEHQLSPREQMLKTLREDLEEHLALRRLYGVDRKDTMKQHLQNETNASKMKTRMQQDEVRTALSSSFGSVDTSQWDGDTSHVHSVDA